MAAVVVVVEVRVLVLELAAELLLPRTQNEHRVENVTNREWSLVVEMATTTCSTRKCADAMVMEVVEESSHVNGGSGLTPFRHPMLILVFPLRRHG